MIVADTSALIAVLKGEPEAQALLDVLRMAERILIGTPTFFEYLMVSVGTTEVGQETRARDLLDRLGVEVVSWTRQHADLATSAFLRYGKGRHPARLNFGDCMAYAVAKSLDAPLLFKGADFRLTDVKVAE